MILYAKDAATPEAIESLKRDVSHIKKQRDIERLREVIVPRELFIDEQGRFDMRAHDNEVYDVLNMGYPNKVLTDERLVNIYAGYLAEKDKATQMPKSNNGIVPGFSVPSFKSSESQQQQQQQKIPSRITTSNSYQVSY